MKLLMFVVSMALLTNAYAVVKSSKKVNNERSAPNITEIRRNNQMNPDSPCASYASDPEQLALCQSNRDKHK
ncbi:MAG: hypothetical protein ACOVQX_02950 [Legionella sp.]